MFRPILTSFLSKAPKITSDQKAISVTQSDTSADVTLSISAESTVSLEYHWYRDGTLFQTTAIGSLTYTVEAATRNWYVVVQNAYGTVISAVVTIYSAYYAADGTTTAIVNALTTAGATVSSSAATAVRNFVIAGNIGGWWAKMSAIYGLYGGASAAHAINWKTPGTYNLAWNGSLAHSSLGVKSTAYNQYGTATGLTYGPGCILNYDNVSLTTYVVAGYAPYAYHGTVFWVSAIGNSGSSYWLDASANLGAVITSSPYAKTSFSTQTYLSVSSGFTRTHACYTSQRQGTAQKMALNGTVVGTATAANTITTSLEGQPFRVIAQPKSKQSWSITSADQHGFFSIGTALTEAEISSLNQAVHTMMTAFSR